MYGVTAWHRVTWIWRTRLVNHVILALALVRSSSSLYNVCMNWYISGLNRCGTSESFCEPSENALQRCLLIQQRTDLSLTFSLWRHVGENQEFHVNINMSRLINSIMVSRNTNQKIHALLSKSIFSLAINPFALFTDLGAVFLHKIIPWIYSDSLFLERLAKPICHTIVEKYQFLFQNTTWYLFSEGQFFRWHLRTEVGLRSKRGRG